MKRSNYIVGQGFNKGYTVIDLNSDMVDPNPPAQKPQNLMQYLPKGTNVRHVDARLGVKYRDIPTKSELQTSMILGQIAKSLEEKIKSKERKTKVQKQMAEVREKQNQQELEMER